MGLGLELRKGLEELEKAVERVERHHARLSLAQSLETKLAARVEELEKGRQRATDVVFPSPVVGDQEMPDGTFSGCLQRWSTTF